MKPFYFPLVFLCCLLSSIGFAQQNISNEAAYEGMVSSVEYVTSMASRPQDLLPVDQTPREAKDKRALNHQINASKSASEVADPLVENRHELEGTRMLSDPSLTFDAYSSNSSPTDPSLAVGPNHVIVVYNTGFTIYNKSGNVLQGPTSPNPAIFPSGGCCDLTASYDNAADRWVLSFLGSGAQVAVSDGPDPINDGWFIYNISTISDYQKLSIWSDGYYLTDNTSSSNKVWAMERSAMLQGNSNAKIKGFNLPSLSTSGFYSPQALNVIDGNMPAAGGATIVYMQDNAWSGVSSDHLKVWTIDVDWNNTNNSTISSAQQIPLASFISVFDNGSFANLAQPGGGSSIDALQATIMNQAQFKKFANHNAAIFNFVVDADPGSGELAAVRWIELRQSGDNQPWSLFQEGTYTAPDGRHAWNASMAFDANGSIGMGYTSMSGPTTPGTVRVSSYYTGRLSTDPAGTMSFEEGLIANGNANFSGFRYGDYSKIDVDPLNGSDFWFITEYMNSGRRGVVGVFELDGTPPEPDFEDPSDPADLIAENITSSSAALSWTASTDNIGVSQYNISIDGIVVGASPNNSFVVTGLNPLTNYTASVTAQDAFGNISGSVSTSFTTLEAELNYCTSTSSNVNDEYISRVQLNTIDNSSDAQFYSDFTYLATTLTEGDSYAISVTPTWLGTIFNEGYAVWIDYNNDGDFTDSGELVWSKSPSSDTPNTGNFTIPTGTASGNTRMRVSMMWNDIPEPCESFTYGEVEDYTVILQGEAPDTETPSSPLNLTAGNETISSIDLSWAAATDNVGVTGYTVFVDGSSIGTVTGTTSNVTGLDPNTTYSFQVQAYDAAGNTSALSNTATASTLDDGSGEDDLIIAHYFETGLDDWVDGGGDCARVSSNVTSYEGQYSVRLRDNSNSSNMRSPILDLSGNTEVTFEFHSYAKSMEDGEDFFIEFYDGTEYVVVANYVKGVDFSNNSFFSPEPLVLSANDYSFGTYNRFRIRNDASANNDKVFFDEIIVRGDIVGSPFIVINDLLAESVVEMKSFNRTADVNISIYPNPAEQELNIKLGEARYEQISIFSASGKLMSELRPSSELLRVDVSDYVPGIYFVRFVSNKQAVTKRFVKE